MNKDMFSGFANPKAAITVGAAGAMVLAFTPLLCNVIPVAPAVTALVLSGVFAVAQLAGTKEPMRWFMYPVYWLLTTLVIYHAAQGGLGTAQAGGMALERRALSAEEPQAVLMSSDMPGPGFSWVTSQPGTLP